MSATFSYDYFPLSKYDTGRANIRQPREIAYFSYDDKRNLLPLSEASMKYYRPTLCGAPGESDPNPEHPCDLGEGFKMFKKHDDSVDEHLDALLDTLQVQEERTSDRVEADFVTWRGMLTKILTAPYEKYDGFEMNAVFYQGTIYIEEHHAYKKRIEESKPENFGPNRASPAEMQFWGYKFEALSTMPKQHTDATREEIESRSKLPVNNIEQYCSIVQTGLGNMVLVLAGEVDCVIGEKELDTTNKFPWVELKTSKVIDNFKDARKYEDKLLKYWAQSFTLGVPHVVTGFRSNDGHLLHVEHVRTRRIPELARLSALKESRRNGPGHPDRQSWNGNLCINFAVDLLSFIKKHVNQPGVVWRIAHRAKSGVVALAVDSSTDPASIVKPSFSAHREKQM